MTWRDDEAGDELSERELPDDSDFDDSDEPDLVECAHCGKAIHEESEWCHHCGNFVGRDEAGRRVPLWVLIGVVVAVVVVLTWII